MEAILPGITPQTASWGDSMTMHATGILDEIKQNPSIDVIEAFAANVPRAELIERRRQALLSGAGREGYDPKGSSWCDPQTSP